MNISGIGQRLRCRARVAMTAVAALLAFTTASESAATAKATPAAFAISPLKADRILVLKSARKLELLKGGVVLKTYPIALGVNPIGPKRNAGDGKTPEGLYTIDGRQPHSHYHLALHISYPNAADSAQAANGHRDPGGDIEIHGLPGWYEGPLNPVQFDKDWTHGCVSVGDQAIEEIYAAVDIGTPIEIRP
ncbi:MAG TPA: L,D-transpeptidase family protein [Stellaceae bacterium]|jgi:murein L,D-transpeptidase YafK